MVQVLWRSVAVHTETPIQTQSLLPLGSPRDQRDDSTLSGDKKNAGLPRRFRSNQATDLRRRFDQNLWFTPA